MNSPVITLQTLCQTLRTKIVANCVQGFELSINGVCSLSHPRANQIGFVNKIDASIDVEALVKRGINALIIPTGVTLNASLKKIPGLIECAQPQLFFAYVSAWFESAAEHQTISHHPLSSVARSAQIDAQTAIAAGAVIGEHVVISSGCRIGANCVIGDHVHIGADSVLYPNVTVYKKTIIGARAVLHSGAVIGADGFGLVPHQGQWIKMPQVGIVVIGDDVEVGANTTIDRATLDQTVIGDGVKLDNQIQIGHNCVIGAHTAIAACTAVGGSAIIGTRCQIGGASVIKGHITIADETIISGGSSVITSIPTKGHFTSIMPVMPHTEWQKNMSMFRNLSNWRARLKTLETRVKDILPL